MTDDRDGLKEHVDLIREVFTYIKRFRDRLFVLKLDYPVIDGAGMRGLVKDLALLHRNGIKTVIVAGARERIDEVLSTYAVSTETVDSVRISPPEVMPLIRMAAFDAANRVMTLLSAQEEQAVISNVVRARSMGVSGGKDYLQTGFVEKVKIELLGKVLEDNFIPILPCIGWNAVGDPYNISSDELAVTIAVQMHAEKLFFVTGARDVFEGLEIPPEALVTEPELGISRLTLRESEEILKRNETRKGHDGLQLLKEAVTACRAGVNRVHIVNGEQDGVLLKEIFSSSGSGIMIYANEYESIRDMREEDIPDVLRIMKPYIDRGFLISRTEEHLEKIYRDFVVYEIDGTIHGCGSLHPYPDGQAEIGGMAVDGNLAYMGIGNRIVSFLCGRAKSRNMRRVFVLTTQASDWFLQLGFEPADTAELPDEKRAMYDRNRNSRVLVRPVE